MFVSNFLFRRAGGCLSSNCSVQIHGWFDDAGAAAPWCGPGAQASVTAQAGGSRHPAVTSGAWRGTATTRALHSTAGLPAEKSYQEFSQFLC